MASTSLPHTLSGVENVNDLTANLNALLDGINSVDAGQLDLATFAQPTGLNSGGTVRRGACIIPGAESRTSTSYGTMATPDQVANVAVPADGILTIVYSASWRESVANAGRAAIFIGSNQLKIPVAGSTPVVQEVQTATGVANIYHPLLTWTRGLATPSGSIADTGDDVTTGQAIALGGSDAGCWCIVKVPAGVYTVSIQTKSSSGSVTLKNRSLWVWTTGF